MPPRFTLGVWWSRYWPYTAEDLEDIAHGYSEHSIPLDVLVSDMAWHYHGENPVKWGGYSWGPQLFPEPDYFLQQVASAKLNTTLNLHLDVVEPPPVTSQLSWDAFVKALGLPPAFNSSIPR
jgi:alpha-glucosidase (family GH31 glycosyl hydrolase)